MGRRHTEPRRLPCRAAQGRALHGRRLRGGAGRLRPGRRGQRRVEPGQLPGAARDGRRRTGCSVSGDATTLELVQRWMHDALIRPDEEAGEMAGRRLAPSPRLSPAAGLAIYQRGYFLRIASCMREQFPALCHALGEALFDDFVADYIRECPPESHTLYDLGRRFPPYLSENRPDRDLAERESWIDFMIDLAEFERQVFTMFDAPGHEGQPFADADTPDA